ncbi:hypothetical protein RF11_00616 [Thelohanellus kitauei]|nr:hypothetical protein RF11_00616 [Thelohanellus kitauei]
MKGIEALSNSGDIASAIYLSMRCGYMYETQHCNLSRSIKFYRKADKLRQRNKIHHCCPFTDDELLKISNDDIPSVTKFEQKTKVNKRVWCWEYKPLGTANYHV